jgi:hypothetical protein
MFTHLFAVTEDKIIWEYDLTISHQAPVDPATKITEISFVSDSGKSLFLKCSFWNNSNLETDQWIRMRNRLCAPLRDRMHEIRLTGSRTLWPLTKWFFERQMERINQRATAQMDWTNYGRDGWVIDHVLPMSCFDFNSPGHLLLCQSLANLRPAWDIHNWARRNTVTIRDITRYVNSASRCAAVSQAKNRGCPASRAIHEQNRSANLCGYSIFIWLVTTRALPEISLRAPYDACARHVSPEANRKRSRKILSLLKRLAEIRDKRG